MRILLLGEYSNVHWTLAQGLRKLGHEVTVVSNGDFWKNYPRDIDVARRPGKLGGICLYLKILALLPKLKGYDIVQLINPIFFELKAERLSGIYERLKKQNGKIVLGAFGMDYYWVNENRTRKPLRYSDFNIGDKLRDTNDTRKEIADWTGTAKQRLNQLIACECDAIVTGLYEYQACYGPLFPEKTTFIPFPIVCDENAAVLKKRDKGTPLRIFIGINKVRSEYKGTDIMLRAARDVAAGMPEKLRLTVVENVPFNEYRKMMLGSDAIVDQLYSYTPSMNPLEAMSHGLICIGGGEPENYEILGETELRPIINVEPNYDSVYSEIKRLALSPDRIPELQNQSIEYTRRHHDYIKVARRYEKLYKSL